MNLIRCAFGKCSNISDPSLSAPLPICKTCYHEGNFDYEDEKL